MLRIVNSLISFFPVFTLFHTKAACVDLIGIIFPATATLDTVLIGEFLSQGPDLQIQISAIECLLQQCIITHIHTHVCRHIYIEIQTDLLEVILCGDVAGLRDAALLGVWQRK